MIPTIRQSPTLPSEFPTPASQLINYTTDKIKELTEEGLINRTKAILEEKSWLIEKLLIEKEEPNIRLWETGLKTNEAVLELLAKEGWDERRTRKDGEENILYPLLRGPESPTIARIKQYIDEGTPTELKNLLESIENPQFLNLSEIFSDRTVLIYAIYLNCLKDETAIDTDTPSVDTEASTVDTDTPTIDADTLTVDVDRPVIDEIKLSKNLEVIFTLIDFLIGKDPQFLEEKNLDGENALFAAAKLEHKLPVLTKLIEANINLLSRGQNGECVLQYAVEELNINAIKALTEANPQLVTCKNKWGKTARAYLKVQFSICYQFPFDPKNTMGLTPDEIKYKEIHDFLENAEKKIQEQPQEPRKKRVCLNSHSSSSGPHSSFQPGCKENA